MTGVCFIPSCLMVGHGKTPQYDPPPYISWVGPVIVIHIPYHNIGVLSRYTHRHTYILGIRIKTQI